MGYRICWWFALSLIVARSNEIRADDSNMPTSVPMTAQRVRQAAECGLDFLVKDAAKWRQEKKCATCHHGTMTVWALAEAKRQGYAVAAETFANITQWTKERLTDIDKPRDARPGWSMVNSPAVVLANMALAVPEQEALSAEELKRIADHLLRHQETNGSWAWSSAPTLNRPPPFFESDEVLTLLAAMALAPHVPAVPEEKHQTRDGRDKGLAWLAKNKPNGTTQAEALRLLFKVRAGEPILSAMALWSLVRFLSCRARKESPTTARDTKRLDVPTHVQG